MITAIVQYKLPPEISHADCERHFHMIAENFKNVEGLHRKNFIWAEDGWAGGIYLWDSMEAARAFYSGPWVEGIRARYGMDPIIRYFETAAITDNKPVAPSIRRFNATRVGAAAES
jgi:hypothetical protein